jgi:soluble lytic murein transglycosylase
LLRLRLSTYVLLSALFLTACSGGDNDNGASDGVSITPVAELTPTPSALTSPTPTTTPGIILTPQPGVNLDLSEAQRLEAEGDLEAAAARYIGIAATAPEQNPLRGAATISAARLLLELEKPADVRVLLEPFVPAAAGDDLVARYLLARSYAALGLWSQSLEQYDLYIQSGRAALPYAYFDRARILNELNQPIAAATSALTGMNLGVPASSRRSFIVSIAQSYERAGSFVDAVTWYRTLIERSDLAGDDALALSRIAAIKRAQGDPTYIQEQGQLLASHPATAQALTDLTEALARGEVIDPKVRGLVYYRNNDYTKAEPAFREQIALSPDAPASALAYYYIAAILESKDDMDGALNNYLRVGALDPASVVADDALWWRARILEDRGNREDAQALFARIVTEYPNSTWAPDAAFRRGMLSYGAGRHQEAADTWAASLAATTNLSERERLTLWQGKALLKAGKRDEGRALLQPMATSGEDDYFGIRAVSLVDGKHGLPNATRESNINLSPNFDWVAAESWLTARTARPIGDPPWASDQRWLRAQELWRIGRVSQGDAEAFDLIEAHASDPIAMYTLSRTLQAQGRIGMSGRAGQRLLRILDVNPNAGLPKPLLSLAYPAAFGPIAQKHSNTERISPLLMLAFVRQESFFDPRAESPVGALGLTQVLPSTGEDIAKALGVNGYESSDLLHADLNLRFGANYMADQLDQFDDEIFVAFAAYNAGPGAADRWRDSSGDDADVFLEAIEFGESRLYVQLVAENYAIYRYLYGGAEKPTLPD